MRIRDDKCTDGRKKKKLKASRRQSTWSRDPQRGRGDQQDNDQIGSATVVAFERFGHHHSRIVMRRIPANPKRRWRTSAEIAIRAS
jgi:hypothetical protein